MKIEKSLIGTLSGNVLVFYDFTIYALFASQISKNFFPTKSEISIRLTFIVLAGGYIMRPLGAVVFGYIGDKLGRRKALASSIILITVSTFLIGLLPNYQMIGILAPILLVLLRFFQGFSVSGEEGGAAVFITEANQFQRIGFNGSMILSSVLFGVLLGSIICWLITVSFSDVFLSQWGWRIPFVMAIIFGMIALPLRLNLPEPLAFKKILALKQLSKNPVGQLFFNHRKSVIASTFLVASFAVSTSIYIVYLPHFLMNNMNLTLNKTLILLTIGILLMTLLIPIFGNLSDKLGHNTILFWSLVSLIVLGLTLSQSMKPNIYFISVIMVILSVVISGIAGPLFALIVSLFPTSIRYSGVSITFNLSETLFAGTTPIVIISLSYFINYTVAIGIYLSAFALLSLVSLMWTTKFNKNQYCLEEIAYEEI
ncbi:MAG: hypothetical protein A3F41_06775 [Coxiella sp. RIFCSPHIGHO2_12_FULL_44_14]|nr:MAG: hypothetical protein A3F41_06775 [Coxiella sp. RIFCSPHIGHO2_12_FULL_44_14]